VPVGVVDPDPVFEVVLPVAAAEVPVEVLEAVGRPANS